MLGVLERTQEPSDPHDLLELEPHGSPWLTVGVPHPDWGDDSNAWYTSDYRSPKSPRQWRFEVRSDEPAPVQADGELLAAQRKIVVSPSLAAVTIIS